MTSKALLILAAGLGSRFGGEKQFVPFGPNGESLMDYSIFDALECGFNRIIIVVRQSMLSMVEMRYSELFEKHEIIFCTQESDTLPKFFIKPHDRSKPYGTAHALMSAAQFIDYPTLIINADDYYGKETFLRMSQFMDSMDQNQVALATFPLYKTLSKNGTVTRGICCTDDNHCLLSIAETYGVRLNPNGTIQDSDGTVLSPNSPASMNVWAISPAFTSAALPYFEEFFSKLPDNDLSGELPLPVMIDRMICDKQINVKTIPVNSDWLGVTYNEDLPNVKASLMHFHQTGVYPSPLFE